MSLVFTDLVRLITTPNMSTSVYKGHGCIQMVMKEPVIGCVTQSLGTVK